jgi:hypothetical protein
MGTGRLTFGGYDGPLKGIVPRSSRMAAGMEHREA